ncbi:MAG: single-stranded DNA-binding protein [Clostridia bacterium]|nr:single-stranded DNA-binding protein [Clostridia bacterium]
MNNVTLVGRLTRDPDMRMSASQTAVTRFTVAVDRAFAARQEGQPTADFISCVAFGKSAEFVDKYFTKGKMIGLQGRIQTGSYTKQDGTKVYTTDVVAERVEFVGGKNDQADGGFGGGSSAPSGNGDDELFKPIGELTDDDIPF